MLSLRQILVFLTIYLYTASASEKRLEDAEQYLDILEEEEDFLLYEEVTFPDNNPSITDEVTTAESTTMTEQPSEGSIRLADGGSTYGRVEIYHAGEWGTVCHDYFTTSEAKVVCRQLGLPGGNHLSKSSAFYGKGSGRIWMDDLACNSNEASLSQCPHRGWGVHDCDHFHDASVICDTGNNGNDEAELRLSSGGEIFGTLEVFYAGKWGKVCRDYFDYNEAKVVCHQLFGLPRTGKHGIATSPFGTTNAPIWLDNLGCIGTENDLGECNHKGWGQYDYCYTPNEVGLFCDRGNDVSIRLKDGGEAYGRLEVLYEDNWGTVCYSSFDTNDAKVVCHQLGFPRNAKHGYQTNAKHGYGTGLILLNGLQCYGGESNLEYCNHNGWGASDGCSHQKDVSVYCDRDLDLPVRIVDGGDAYGRVEIQYEGIWGTVCHDGWDSTDAKVVCKQLGFSTFGIHGAVGIEHFGQGTGEIWLDDVACNGNEGHIRHCSHGGIGTHNCNHADDVGVFCDRAIDREVRLASGNSTYGRVEVNYEGIWGTVGDYSWGSSDAKVVCRQLGFPADGRHGAMSNAHFGEGTGHMWLDYLACDGNELNIRSCGHQGWGVHPYSSGHRDDAGVYCDRGVDCEVRLVGGNDAYGRVEVNYEGIWGTICDTYWDHNEAKVVCAQLGFPRDGKHWYSTDAFFGEGTGSIWLYGVGCTGNEKNIRLCSHNGWGVASCNHRDDAGVFCDRDVDIEVRLADGDDDASGRVEVNYEGQWGTLCDDNFDNNDAKVICRQLGFPDGNHIAKSGVYFPGGSGQIWISHLACIGTEDNINDCGRNQWRNHHCSHSEDAGVICERGPTTLQPTTQADGGVLTLPPATADVPGEAVQCNDNHMTVYIPRTIIGGTDGSELYFVDRSCTGTNYNSTHVRIDTELSECGTVREIRGKEVVFSNMIHNEAQPGTPGSIISRERSILIPVECFINREGIASISFNPDTASIIYYEDGHGDFSFQLQLYRDDSYSDPYEPEEYPVNVNVREVLHFEADVIAEEGLDLFVETCLATTTVNPYSSPQYHILKDGCGQDDTFEFIPTNDPMTQRFEVEAFKFTGTNSTVYIHCFLLVCDMTNSSSRCSQGCIQSRHRRDADGVHLPGTNTKSYLMSQGPLTFITDEEPAHKGIHYGDTRYYDHDEEVSLDHYEGQWNIAIGSVALMMLCATVLVMKIKRKPLEGNDRIPLLQMEEAE